MNSEKLRFPERVNYDKSEIAYRSAEKKLHWGEFKMVQPVLKFICDDFPFLSHDVGLPRCVFIEEVAEIKNFDLLNCGEYLVADKIGSDFSDIFRVNISVPCVNLEILKSDLSIFNMEMPNVTGAAYKEDPPEDRSDACAVCEPVSVITFKNTKPMKDEHYGTSCAISLFLRNRPRAFFKSADRLSPLQSHKIHLSGQKVKSKHLLNSTIPRSALGAKDRRLVSFVHGLELVKRLVHFGTVAFASLNIGDCLESVKFKTASKKKLFLFKAFLAILFVFLFFAPLYSDEAVSDTRIEQKTDKRTDNNTCPERTHKLQGGGNQSDELSHDSKLPFTSFDYLMSGLIIGIIAGYFIRYIILSVHAIFKKGNYK